MVEAVGSLKDLVVDMQTGRAKFAIISSGGFLGLGADQRPVPAQLISTATAKKNIIQLKTGRLQWTQAPSLQSGQLAELSRPETISKIETFYRVPQPPANLAVVQGGSVPTPTGRETGESGKAQGAHGGLELASDLVGQDVVNRQQEAIGEISDLLVDLSGKRPTFAILTAGRLLKSDRTFAVPLRAITLNADGTAVIDANREMLNTAKRV